MTAHPGGHGRCWLKTLHQTEPAAHPNMLAMGCMEKSARAELAGSWHGETRGQGWEHGDGRVEMREWGAQRQHRDSTETRGWGQDGDGRAAQTGMQRCARLGCWTDGSTLRDPGSLVSHPAALVSAGWGGQHSGQTAGHRTDTGTHTEHSRPRRVFFHGCCTRNSRNKRAQSPVFHRQAFFLYLWPGAW